jgi:hypothetical protein
MKPGFITIPARGDMIVIGTVGMNVPRNIKPHNMKTPVIVNNVISPANARTADARAVTPTGQPPPALCCRSTPVSACLPEPTAVLAVMNGPFDLTTAGSVERRVWCWSRG